MVYLISILLVTYKIIIKKNSFLHFQIRRKSQSIHFSGKFSAKEASKKALMSSGISNIYFKDIEVLNKQNGEPYIKIDKIDPNYIKNIQVSISHTNLYATAFVVLEL